MSFIKPKQYTHAEFRALTLASDMSWADGVTIHHTAYPDLAMRPEGLTLQHLKNLIHYYRDDRGWSSGPHLFADDKCIGNIANLEQKGVHAKAFNRNSIGIEILGDYDTEDPDKGRGLLCVNNAAEATATLLQAMDLEPTHETIRFHRDDPRTNKTCPGTRITKDAFIERVMRYMNIKGAEKEPTLEDHVASLLRRVAVLERRSCT